LAVLGLVVVLGCAGLGNANAVKYNNDLAGITKDLEAVDKELENQSKRNFGNPAMNKQAYDKAQARTTDILRRGRAITAYDSPAGRALHQEYLKFLDTYEEIMNVDYRNIIEGKTLGDPGEINRIQKKANERTQALRAAQQRFAQENNFQIQN
jgi:hypothetical protein